MNNNNRHKPKADKQQKVTSFMKNKISRLKSGDSNKNAEPVDTTTPEWIAFKRANYVY